MKCIEAIRDARAGGESALFIVLNHAGDVLSANIAMEAVEREGLNVKMVLTQEDIAGGPIGRSPGPGGISPGLQGGRRRGRTRALARKMSRDRPAHGAKHAHAGGGGAAPRLIPQRASPSSSWATTRWRSAWASTAKLAPAACS